MKRKILVFAAAVLLGVGGFCALSAKAQAAGLRREAGTMRQQAKAYLGLTAAQVAQIRDILKQDREALIDLAVAVHEGRAQLRDTIQNDTASEADVRAAAAGLARAQANMAVERHMLFGRIKPILTPQQLTKLAQIQEQVDAFADGVTGVIGERLAE
jgi:Spy/CpxP family protein refolding chaperone